MSDQDPFVGKVIDGRYEIQQRVGEGGMGVVYKARQMSIDRIIALKMLNQQMQGDQQWIQRFYNEAKACSRLQHPNTIRMFDFGQTQDGRLFMTMEFLDGLSLRDALARGPLAPQRVVKILIQCCASLAEAHSIGIIHRDIKPDNVFLLNMAGSPDFVKLLDFSVAKLLEGDRMKTQAGVVFGTPQYMSPEQGRGAPLDARSDLYALGVLAFEMLTGNVPFNDDNPMTVIQMHLHGAIPPMPDSIPYSVQQIVRRAMEKDAARRYQSSGEMMQHCQQVFAELNQGSVSVGGGGVPRTMIAGLQPPQQQPQQYGGFPPPQQQPQQQSGLAPQQQYAPAGAQAKTMIAGQSPFANGQLPQMQQQPPQQPQQPQQQPGNFVQSSPMQKTIVAGMVPPIVGGQMQPQGTPQGYQPQPVQQQPGPNKTVVMQPTDGVVSMANRGSAGMPMQGMPGVNGMNAGPMTGPHAAAGGGASTLFWIVSLAIGIAVGVLAYVIVLQMCSHMPGDDDIKVKQLLDGGASLADVVDAATQRELEKWFALPSFEAAPVAPEIIDADMQAVVERRAKACAAVDPVLLELIYHRTEVAPESLLKHEYKLDLHVDPSIAQFDQAMVDRAYQIAEPREVEQSEELKDDLKECAPQALLRDLHRPELVFEKLFEVIDYSAEQRLDIVAEVDAAMKMNLKLPPLAASPFSEEHALLVQDRAIRRRPWNEITLRNRRVDNE